MAVNLIRAQCPNCGASLNIEEDCKEVCCEYCGSKVLLHNENEASVKQAETDRIVRMKQMELADRKYADALKTKALKIKLSLIFAIAGVMMILIGFAAGHASGDSNSWLFILAIMGIFSLCAAGFLWISILKDEEDLNSEDKARVPSSVSDFAKKDYSAIAAMFESAGFTNVRCVPLNDLAIGLLKRPGMVESITVNGETVTSGGKGFPKNAPVVISYHSMIR